MRIPTSNFTTGGALNGYVTTVGGSDPDNDDNTDSNAIDVGAGDSRYVTALTIELTSGGEPVNDGDTDPYTNLTVDFGFWPQPASIGDLVWYDDDKDGLQDTKEVGVEGVTVYLLDAAGNRIPGKVRTTDANGKYLFDTLPPGQYAIEFVLPDGYILTLMDVDCPPCNEEVTRDMVDSDVGSDGKTPTTELTVGEQDMTWDMGIYRNPLNDPDGVEPDLFQRYFLPLTNK